MQKKLLNIFFTLISFSMLFLFLTPNKLFAQYVIDAGGGSGSYSLKCDLDNGISTAIGCIPIHNREAFLTFLLGWAIGIAGGIGFLSIIFGGYSIMTSSGNPDKIQAGKELITASITGILFLVFSTFLLKLFGVEIFRIPGF